MTKKLVYIFLSVFIIISVHAQDGGADESQKKISLEGYISNMQSVMFDSLKGNWISDNLIHNRLNFSWFPSSALTFSLQVRNRFIWGESVQLDPGYGKQVENDNGYLQLSKNLLSERSFIFNSSIDRVYLEYSNGSLDMKLGRQRINWGQTMVWNPNDIFNNYSFFDFDYVERPGSDAIRIQYYPSSSSTVEFAGKVNHQKKLTAAALYRFNKWGYDIQFIGGLLNETDFVIGAGWSGAIEDVSFRGELSYFHPKKNLPDDRELFMSSISFDYSFQNSSSILVEGLYGSLPENSSSGFLEVYNAPATVKNLSFTKYNLLGQYTYLITPLLSLSFSAMVMPGIDGYYAGPTLSYSLKDNLDLSFIAQAFSGNFPDSITGIDQRLNLYLGFIRLKANF